MKPRNREKRGKRYQKPKKKSPWAMTGGATKQKGRRKEEGGSEKKFTFLGWGCPPCPLREKKEKKDPLTPPGF